METNQDEIVHLIGKQDNSVEEIKVGLKVHSEEEAYNLYNQFALSKGFSIRKGNKRRSMTEPIRQREFLCSKSGYHEHEDIGKVKNFSCLETRTSCQAKIRFTIWWKNLAIKSPNSSKLQEGTKLQQGATRTLQLSKCL
ncbi:hypothetical protein J1N35_010964 [Gossypium stocksii]|uniref:FAR1 domain-containing protein n=1 Tax=Gossypium stocksii TaxID=47602 RepID=A0A9D3W128_9ROSI|nr:hypothetical protein J1N35_010964 [Gossypium stocksii]